MRFFCCGWDYPICVLDTVLHRMGIHIRAVCDRHDRFIWRLVEAKEISAALTREYGSADAALAAIKKHDKESA